MFSGFSITGHHDGGYPSSSKPSTFSVHSSSPFLIHTCIGHISTSAILDTGSSITLVNLQFLNRLSYRQFTYTQKKYSSANGSAINIIGEITLPIRINTLHTPIIAAVASELVTDVLLGTDWIDHYVRSIHVTDRTLTVHDNRGQSTITSLLASSAECSLSVTLTHQRTLLPHSESMVNVRINHPNNSSLLFTPSPLFQYTPVQMIPSLINIHRNQSTILLCNNTDRPYSLARHTKLGTATPDRFICGTSLLSSSINVSSSPSSEQYQCYVCNQHFRSNNDLYRHLRAQCYPSTIRTQIENLTTHISLSSARDKVQHILWKHARLFDTTKPSKINITLENAIETGNHRPTYTTPYRRSPADHHAIDQEAQNLLRQQYIEPSTSPWCSPVVLVRKPDGSNRFCVDYRKLNDITTKDSFPLPRLDDILDQLSGSYFFTKLDFKNGYFQVPLAPRDRPKTAFSTRDNHYQFTVLPQGIKNGPPTFQRIVNQVLGPTRWKYCLAYIDDVLIFSKTFDDHLHHLDTVLQLLADANFRLSISKCSIATNHIEYLGHSIQDGFVRPNNTNIRALLETSTPNSPREAFRFVKAAEYYRKFIQNFSTIAGPLYKYAPSPNQSSKTGGVFQLSAEEHHAFDRLKKILTGDLVLRLPNMSLPFKIQTDASQIGIGAVLLQTYPEGDRPVCFMSKKLSSTQQRWPVIEQECYAVITAINHWHHYLHGQHFILETDHRPLETLMKKRQVNLKCERWRLLLQSYDFTIKHISGKSNNMSDYLSRSPVDSATDDEDEHGQLLPHKSSNSTPVPLPVAAVTTRSHTRQLKTLGPSESISSAQHSNTSLSTVTPSTLSSSANSNDLRIDFTGDLDTLRAAQSSDVNLKYIIDHIHEERFAKNYSINEGLLMFHTSQGKVVPCVPSGKIRRDIITLYHDTPGNGGHFGRDKTIRKIRDRYYWHSMNNDIINHIRSCLRCTQNNPVRRRPPGHLQPIPSPEGTWQIVAMDFHGPINPTSRRGNRYIISLTDLFSKFVIARPVRDCTAATAARFLQEEVICQFGTPKWILTDNGTHFTSSMMEQLLKRFGIIHLYSTPYHPQSNGQIERFNSTMDAKIAALSNQNRSDWDDQLSFVIFNYNTSVHSITRIIPFQLMYGRSPVLPCDPQTSVVSFQNHSDYLEQSNQHLSSLTTAAHQHITKAQKHSKSHYDRYRSNPTYQINDLVLLRNTHRRYKFDIRYEGPYRVIQRIHPKTYIVQHLHTQRCIRQVTVDSIVPLIDRHTT